MFETLPRSGVSTSCVRWSWSSLCHWATRLLPGGGGEGGRGEGEGEGERRGEGKERGGEKGREEMRGEEQKRTEEKKKIHIKTHTHTHTHTHTYIHTHILTQNDSQARRVIRQKASNLMQTGLECIRFQSEPHLALYESRREGEKRRDEKR
jgi:hypothetical protein